MVMKFASAPYFCSNQDVMIGGRYSELIQDLSYKKSCLLLSDYLLLLHFFPLKNSDKMLDYLETKAERDAFIDKYDNFLFDCDGMLYINMHVN